MEEEIDLRRYVAVLIKYWIWIIGAGIAAAVIVFGLTSFMSPSYKATALVAATQPQYQLQFDSRFQNIPDWAMQQMLRYQYSNYPLLATGDELVKQLAEKTNQPPETLKNKLKVEESENLGLLELSVRGKDPENVAAIANMWAEQFVLTVNNLYGNDQSNLEQFEQQQEQAALALAEADAALAAFRTENGFYGFSDVGQVVLDNSEVDFSRGLGLIGQRLKTKNNLLISYEAELVHLGQMQGEIERLAATTTADTSPVVIAGLLSKMINMGLVEESQPYQITLTAIDPAAALAAMAQALESRQAAVEAEINKLQESIPTLQAELAAKQNQLEQLTRDQEIAAETYQIISRKVEEARLEQASNQPTMKLANRAVVPVDPVGPRRLLYTIMAGFLGVAAAVFIIFTREWWQAGEETTSPPQETVDIQQPEANLAG